MLYRDSYIEFNLDNLNYNIKHIKEKNNKKLICVIKANGYGNGDKYIANECIKAGCDYLAVSSLDEAMSLRDEKINAPILILGYVNPCFYNLCIEHDITLTSISLDWVNEICQYPIENLKIHLKVDTGMNRIGINNLNDLKEALNKLINKKANVEGIFTHFACSDVKDQIITHKQYQKFEYIINNLNYDFKYIHSNNTDATIAFNSPICNTNRVGLGIYGYSTFDYNLKPCVKLFSKIINIKQIHKGDFVGYGASYIANNDEYIATIPIGYADGWIRKNQGRKAYIEGSYGEFVGRICMDQCMLKVDKPFPVNTTVELFGDHIKLIDLANELDTIPYEVLTILSDRLTKIYYSNNEIVHIFTPRFNHEA